MSARLVPDSSIGVLTAILSDLQDRIVRRDTSRRRIRAWWRNALESGRNWSELKDSTFEDVAFDFAIVDTSNFSIEEMSKLKNRLEDLLIEILDSTPEAETAIRVFSEAVFNVGVLAGPGLDDGLDRYLERLKSHRTLDAVTKNREAASKKRREIGEPVRQAARELMRRRPHLTWTACANAIAGDRDQRGVARLIEPLFPKGPAGKRRYVGEVPPDNPD